jgi:hypothetical protein
VQCGGALLLLLLLDPLAVILSGAKDLSYARRGTLGQLV